LSSFTLPLYAEFALPADFRCHLKNTGDFAGMFSAIAQVSRYASKAALIVAFLICVVITLRFALLI
jgi:hypothetical protein